MISSESVKIVNIFRISTGFLPNIFLEKKMNELHFCSKKIRKTAELPPGLMDCRPYWFYSLLRSGLNSFAMAMVAATAAMKPTVRATRMPSDSSSSAGGVKISAIMDSFEKPFPEERDGVHC